MMVMNIVMVLVLIIKQLKRNLNVKLNLRSKRNQKKKRNLQGNLKINLEQKRKVEPNLKRNLKKKNAHNLYKTNNSKLFVQCRKYYRYRTMLRKEPIKVSNPLHRYGKLWQQYLVDSWAKCQTNDLNWIRNNQSSIRHSYANGLEDAIKDNTVQDSGKPSILPASHIGSPRWFHQQYQNAMAIVQKYKKPDLFITFTCNPKWKEITKNLFDNQTAYDRPDIVARVFARKREELLRDLMNNDVFGKAIAHCETVEFQKRGLPHLHILIILSRKDSLKTTVDYDQIVSAEIPDKEKSPRLFKAVMKHMVHHHTEHCFKKTSYCCKLFPKPYCNATRVEEDGYPIYRRRHPQKVSFTLLDEVFSEKITPTSCSNVFFLNDINRVVI